MPRESVPAAVQARIRAVARDRCGYCLSPQRLVMARLEIEHIVPVSHGGTSDESTLWLSCPLCNRAKADRTHAPDPDSGSLEPLFNPRLQKWSDHFRWVDGGLRITGTTPVGRATVAALHLDDDVDAIAVRGYWILAGWHPPDD
jgi:hypothetical protein